MWGAVRNCILTLGADQPKQREEAGRGWVFDTGEPGGLQTSPIIVAMCSTEYPNTKIFALNAATGKLLWEIRFGDQWHTA